MKKITVYLTDADEANFYVLKRLLPRHSIPDIVGDALRAYRDKLESQPPREPIRQSAADATRDLFGE